MLRAMTLRKAGANALAFIFLRDWPLTSGYASILFLLLQLTLRLSSSANARFIFLFLTAGRTDGRTDIGQDICTLAGALPSYVI